MTKSKVRIIVDSTAYLPSDLVEQYSIKVIPQILIWGEETYRDDVDIKPSAFYEMLQQRADFPKTSQATVQDFKDAYTTMSENAAGILAIVISSDLSGTYNSATQAKAALPDLNIEIVDSRMTAMGLGFIVLAAARAVEAGKSLEEVAQVARDTIDKVGVIFAVNTLEFLHRGGRIGGARRFLGTALNIKPILHVADGKVEALDQVRTRKKSIRFVLDAVAEHVAGHSNVRIASIHAAAPDDAQLLLEAAIARFNPVETIMAEVSPVVGAHTGPGTLGLIWCVDV